MIETLKDTLVGLFVLVIVLGVVSGIGFAFIYYLGPIGFMLSLLTIFVLFASWVVGNIIRDEMKFRRSKK